MEFFFFEVTPKKIPLITQLLKGLIQFNDRIKLRSCGYYPRTFP